MGQFVKKKPDYFLKLDLTHNSQLLKVNAYLSTEKNGFPVIKKHERNHSPKNHPIRQ